MRDFSAVERCDRCGARAWHAAAKAGSSELLFCNHCYLEVRDGLLKNYWLIESAEHVDGQLLTTANKE